MNGEEEMGSDNKIAVQSRPLHVLKIIAAATQTKHSACREHTCFTLNTDCYTYQTANHESVIVKPVT